MCITRDPFHDCQSRRQVEQSAADAQRVFMEQMQARQNAHGAHYNSAYQASTEEDLARTYRAEQRHHAEPTRPTERDPNIVDAEFTEVLPTPLLTKD